MTDTTATVFIVDDDPAIRDSLTLMIAQDKFNVIAFESAEQFITEYKTCELSCAIIDVRMAGMDGLQLQNALNKRHVQLPIIFLTGHGDIAMSVKAVKAGAVDFLTKPVTRDKLLTAIKSAIAEAEQILTDNTGHHKAISLIESLTGRERDVAILAVQGYPNKDIARRLGISHRTVEIHKSNIMHKTGATNLLELARIAHDGGLTDNHQAL